MNEHSDGGTVPDPGLGDGAVDRDGDGIADTLYVDLDGDGIVDTVMLDLDGDGVADVAQLDYDQDGYADEVVAFEPGGDAAGPGDPIDPM